MCQGGESAGVNTYMSEFGEEVGCLGQSCARASRTIFHSKLALCQGREHTLAAAIGVNNAAGLGVERTVQCVLQQCFSVNGEGQWLLGFLLGQCRVLVSAPAVP